MKMKYSLRGKHKENGQKCDKEKSAQHQQWHKRNSIVNIADGKAAKQTPTTCACVFALFHNDFVIMKDLC